MEVRCKWCGAKNEKENDAYSCVCIGCEKTTYYYVSRMGGEG